MDFKYKKMGIEGEELNKIMKNLSELLENEVKKNISEGILLSGGLDTSILTFLGKKYNKNLKAFSLKFKDSPDYKYSKKLCEILDIKHYVFDISEEELLKNTNETIKILKSFDPMEIRNSVAIYSIMKFSKEYVKSVMTGDGADELFFGYDFLINMNKKKLKEYSRRMWERMHFSSKEIGKFFKLKVVTPFLSDEIMKFAKSIDDEIKIKNNIGKWILRKSFENLIPNEFLWQEKRPMEIGSGTTLLTEIISKKISDEDFLQNKLKFEKEDEVIIRNKEHLYYYQIYKEIFGNVKKAEENEIKCKGCGAKIYSEKEYCKICGTQN